MLAHVLGEISAQPSPTIQTNPTLPNNTIASGYVGLQLHAQVQSGMYHVCTWHYGNIVVADLFTLFIPCNNNDGEGYELNCTNINNLINSTLTILLATSESLTVRVDCQEDPLVSTVENIASFNLVVSSK